MVDVAPVEALYQELPREAEVLANLERLFVDVFGGKVLGNAAVVGVAQFDFVVLMVEQVVHIYVVNVSLDILQVQIIFVGGLSSDHGVIVLSIFFIVFFVLLV